MLAYWILFSFFLLCVCFFFFFCCCRGIKYIGGISTPEAKGEEHHVSSLTVEKNVTQKEGKWFNDLALSFTSPVRFLESSFFLVAQDLVEHPTGRRTDKGVSCNTIDDFFFYNEQNSRVI